MDAYSAFKWDVSPDSPWATLPTSYSSALQNQFRHATPQLAQGFKAQESSKDPNRENNASSAGTNECDESVDDASICSDQCRQVSCSDCCSETTCQPDCLTPCENPDTCEVPDGCALTACADSSCLVELPICSNDTCHSPHAAANWQAWQESFFMGSHESYDHNMLSTSGGLEAYPSTILDCYRIIQGLHLHVYGFCSQRTIHQAVINHIRTYHGQRIAQCLNAHPDLLPTPYICSTGVDQGCPGDFAHGPTAPALSILSFSMGSEHAPPAAFTSELRRKDSILPDAGRFNDSALGSTQVDTAAPPTKRRMFVHPTKDDHYNHNETILSNSDAPNTPCSHEDDATHRKGNQRTPGDTISVSNCDVVGPDGFEAKQQRSPERNREQQDRKQKNHGQDDLEHRALSQATQQPNAPEQHACMWAINHTSGAICGTTFESARLLQDHVDKVHVNHLTAAGGLKCQWQHCQRDGKPFEQKLKLMRHVFSHTKGMNSCSTSEDCTI